MTIHQRTPLTIALIAFSISAFITGCGHKAGEPFTGPVNDLKRYPFERLHITYEFAGDARGNEELFVAGFGKFEARRTQSDMFSPGGIDTEDKGAITRLYDVYTLDFRDSSAIHQHIQYLDSLYHLEKSEMPTAQQYFEWEMKRNFFTNSGIDTVWGKPATRWRQNDGGLTLWIWNGILLRKNTRMESRSIDMILKSIDTNWVVDSSRFNLPPGYGTVEAH